MSEDLQPEHHVFSHLNMGDRVPLGTIIDLVECRINIKKSLKKLGLKRKKIDRLWSRKQVVDPTLLTEVVELCRGLERYVFEDAEEAQAQVHQLVEKLYPSGEPQEVRVTISGPEWLDSSIWMPEGEIVPPSMARAILHRLDGVWLDGVAVEVDCKPAIRPGKKPQRRTDEKTRRRRLFSRWYEGVRADEEGLYSLTPEALALEVVRGLEGVVIDGTCGLGALAIAAARQPGVRTVIAIDSSSKRLKMAEHNAGLYGVGDRIRWIHDSLENCLPLEGDVLLLDPPWGGRDYDRREVRLDDLGMPVVEVLNSFHGRVLLKLPKSFLTRLLPGTWRVQPAVDERGYVKFLVAIRD